MTVIKLKYWGILARASGLFRMLEESGVAYQHVQDKAEMECAFFGAESTNLAPPVLQVTEDDGTTVSVSQAAACHQYLGNKLGFNKGIVTPELAVQYLLDLNDLHSEMAEASMKGKATNDVHALQDYLTGDRYKRHLKAINRCIQGPFYFGKEPTYVDFATASYLDMCEGKWLAPLQAKSGDTIQQYAPKLRSIIDHIRALPSAKKLEKLPLVPSSIILSEERVATWKSTDAKRKHEED